MPPVLEKVAAYITWKDKLLVFRQPAAPEAGVQVPAGTLEAGEDPWHAVLREAREETGLAALQIVSYLGPHESTFENERGARITVRRHFFHLQFNGEAHTRWQHWELTPSGGVEGPILFELWWAPLHDAGALLQQWFAPFLSEISVSKREEQ